VTDDEQGTVGLRRDGHGVKVAGMLRNARVRRFLFSDFGFPHEAVPRMEGLQRLVLWMDAEPRPGPEAMAADEWLLATARVPVLRVYQWDGAWGSLGVFGKLAEAHAAFPELSWVRRWTGGGLVDHRSDWTYTLAIPQSEALARARGAESYRWVHLALAGALKSSGAEVELAGTDAKTGVAVCFENPVTHDLVGESGAKLAGAGQRRTRAGLLHQGSGGMPCAGRESLERAQHLAAGLSARWETGEFHPDPQIISNLVRARYGSLKWTEKR
jgi:lipoate-protein ligase A